MSGEREKASGRRKVVLPELPRLPEGVSSNFQADLERGLAQAEADATALAEKRQREELERQRLRAIEAYGPEVGSALFAYTHGPQGWQKEDTEERGKLERDFYGAVAEVIISGDKEAITKALLAQARATKHGMAPKEHYHHEPRY